MERDLVEGTNGDVTILLKAIGFDAEPNLFVAIRGESILKQPSNFIGANEEGSRGEAKIDAGLKEIPGVDAAELKANLLRSTDRVKHAKLSRAYRTPVCDPGVLVPGVPELWVVLGPALQLLEARVRHLNFSLIFFDREKQRGSCRLGLLEGLPDPAD
jgi:hypothetical protein